MNTPPVCTLPHLHPLTQPEILCTRQAASSLLLNNTAHFWKLPFNVISRSGTPSFPSPPSPTPSTERTDSYLDSTPPRSLLQSSQTHSGARGTQRGEGPIPFRNRRGNGALLEGHAQDHTAAEPGPESHFPLYRSFQDVLPSALPRVLLPNQPRPPPIARQLQASWQGRSLAPPDPRHSLASPDFHRSQQSDCRRPSPASSGHAGLVTLGQRSALRLLLDNAASGISATAGASEAVCAPLTSRCSVRAAPRAQPAPRPRPFPFTPPGPAPRGPRPARPPGARP